MMTVSMNYNNFWTSSICLDYFMNKSVIIFLLILVVLIMLVLVNRKSDQQHNNEVVTFNEKLLPPGPKEFPIIGSLHLLAKYPIPWEVFVHLRDIYGDVFRIVLGNTECVVINSLESIREVLLQKADRFSGRPNFLRYHALFGGSRDRSLALCDWSKVQKLRRRLALPYVFPRYESDNFDNLEEIIQTELKDYFSKLTENCRSESEPTTIVFDKHYFSLVTANIFFKYFCSKSYSYEDVYFKQMVERFDDIFHDINNGFALDFLPWLLPFYAIHLSKLYFYGQFIRRFLMTTLIKEWVLKDDFKHAKPQDFLDVVLMRTDANRIKKKCKRLTSDYALYELEDILGGHTAVSCFWARVLVQIAPHRDIQKKIQEEVDSVLSATHDDTIRLNHRSLMPYTQAVMMETLRMTTSPIVPHVAVQDTTIGGYNIRKDTLIFINNYYLNRNEKFWSEPHKFDPTRFLTSDGVLQKPEHFIPFGVGKRSCMGYQLVQSITFLATTNLLGSFDIYPPKESNRNVPPVEPAKLSVYNESVRVLFRKRVFE